MAHLITNWQTPLKNLQRVIELNDEELNKQIKHHLQQIDNEICTQIIFNDANIVKRGKRVRKIIDHFSSKPIILKRQRLYNKITKKNFYPLDKCIGLQRNGNFDASFIDEIKTSIQTRGYSTLKQLALLQPYKTNKTQIHRIIKFQIKGNSKQQKQLLDSQRALYVNIDDTFLHLIVDNKLAKVRIRLFILHQGKDLKNSRLINLVHCARIIFSNQNETNNAQKTKFLIEQLIEEYYTGEPKKLVICSDGATEFRKVAGLLKVSQNLDTFHFSQKLWATFKPQMKKYAQFSKKTRNAWYHHLKEISKQSPEQLIQVLNKIIDFVRRRRKIQFWKELLKTKKYIENNFEGIRFWQDPDYYPVTTEVYIFHKIKGLLGNKNKCFSLAIFKKLLSFNVNLI